MNVAALNSSVTCRSSRMIASLRLAVQGGRRLVHQQHGRVAHERPGNAPTRWRCPPQSWCGRFARACPRPTRSSRAAARSPAARAVPPRRRRASDELLHRGERGQEVGLLEDDADLVPPQCGAAGVGQSAGVLAVDHHQAGPGPANLGGGGDGGSGVAAVDPEGPIRDTNSPAWHLEAHGVQGLEGAVSVRVPQGDVRRGSGRCCSGLSS